MKDKRKSGASRPERREPSLRWTGQLVETTVEKLVPGGQGMARHEGQVVFVPGVLPGERIEIELSAAKGGYRRARLVSIVTPSVDRIEPACPHYGSCGGCDLQHASHEAQLRYKRTMLEDTLRRQGGYGIDGDLPPIYLVAGTAWGYRNRMQFHVLPAPVAGAPVVGLKRRASDSIEPIAECPVAAVEIQRWLSDPTDPARFSSLARAAGAGVDDGLRLAVYGAQGRLASGESLFSIGLSGKNIRFGVNGFFQSNAEMLDRLAGIMRGWLGRIGTIETAADLYCGCGVFAALLPENCKHIEAVDNDPVNCRFARENTDPSRTAVFEGDVDAWLAGRETGFPDLVIVDPPRTGLSRSLLGRLCTEGPRHLFFVSCDPVTFSRDLKELRQTGYAVKELVLLDFYPQTSHIETACWLERT